MIRLFASDLDGTLLNLMHQVDDTIRRAISEVVASGAHFAVATGRTMRESGEFGLAGLGCEAVCANGSMVLDGNGELVRFEALDPAFVEELLRAFPAVPFECVGREQSYVRGSEAALRAGFKTQGVVRSAVMSVVLKGMLRSESVRSERRFDQTDAEVLSHEVCKVNCRIPDAGLASELHAFLDERADSAINAPFNPSMFEITRTGVNKGEAVAWLAARHGIGEDEVAVYGDGGNDVDMLARFAAYGHAYAPLGAGEGAKRAASEVIGPCALHAVSHHMVRTVRAQGQARRA